MFGLTLSLGLGRIGKTGDGTTPDWILAAGAWNDGGVWDDNETWNDS